MDYYKLNKNDYKLIEELDMNSRQSLSELSSKLNISKQAILKKIDRFNNDFLKCTSVIDIFKLEYGNVHIYLKLQGLNRTKHDSFIKDISNIKNIVWIADLFGDFDLGLSIFYHDMLEIKNVIRRIDGLIGKYIVKREILFIDRMELLNFKNESNKNKRIVMEQTTNHIEIKEIDLKILNLIKFNSRITLNELSKTLDKKPETIKKHISFLEEAKILLGYKVLIDWNKINMIYGVVILKMIPGIDLTPLIETLRKEKDIPFISTTLEGGIIFDIISKDYNQIKDFLNHIKENNEKHIISYKLLTVNHSDKYKEVYSLKSKTRCATPP